jgi:GntR family transcriptional regulator/MocR family aminotransferase
MLRQARGVSCSETQVIITTTGMVAGDLVYRLMVRPRDCVWIEDPGTEFPVRQLEERQAAIKHLPCDEKGATIPGDSGGLVPRLAMVSGECGWVTGQQLAQDRRTELLKWAGATGAYIAEADWDWAFNFDQPGLRAMQGSPGGLERVFYFGTFLQTIGAGFRVGFVVVPPQLESFFATAAQPTRLGVSPPIFMQLALARFIEDGHFLKHIRRIRGTYSQRRQVMIKACRDHFGSERVLTGHGGLHVTIPLSPDEWSDVEIVRRAHKVGMNVGAMSVLCWSAHKLNGLMLGYASTPNAQIEPAVKKLAQIVQASRIR